MAMKSLTSTSCGKMILHEDIDRYTITQPSAIWTVITVLIVLQRQAVITRFYSIACLVRTELNTLIGKP